MQTNDKNPFSKEIKFVGAATSKQNLQVFALPEIAFFGKSNVGKSSLLNSLCMRKTLARVSKTPGCTKQINFFSIDEQFILADLPGYGYSQVSKTLANNWELLILHYLSNRDTLRKVMLLVDSRRGLKNHDLQIIELILDHEKHYDIVFTKIDQITAQEKIALQAQTLKSLEHYYYAPKIFFTSSRQQSTIAPIQDYTKELAK